MQLPGIIVLLLSLFVLVVGNDGGVSYGFSSTFSDELESFQTSLIRHVVENTALDPKQDNVEIETIARAILDEAERRLRKRQRLKHIPRDDVAREVEYKGDKHEEAIRHLASGLYRDLVKLHGLYSQGANDENDVDNGNDRDDGHFDGNESDENDGENSSHDKKDGGSQDDDVKNNFKREILDEAQIEEEYIDKLQRRKKEIIRSDPVWHRESRFGAKPSIADNNQVATVAVDNSLDLTTKIADSEKNLLLEPYLNVSKSANQTAYAIRHGPLKVAPPRKIVTTNKVDRSGLDKFSFIAVVAACCVAGMAGILLASFCWYKLRSETKEYNNKGVGEFKSNSVRNGYKGKGPDEAKLAQGAEVFHYLHAKKQIQQMEEPVKASDRGLSINESTDEEEEEEDTVYECSGLAPPGDMRVVNPLFSDGENHYSDNQTTTPSPPMEEK